jgi:hypothetical protein
MLTYSVLAEFMKNLHHSNFSIGIKPWLPYLETTASLISRSVIKVSK